MSRYWDGRVRAVVRVLRFVRLNGSGRVPVELLECGHEFAFTGPRSNGNGTQWRVCQQCPEPAKKSSAVRCFPCSALQFEQTGAARRVDDSRPSEAGNG